MHWVWICSEGEDRNGSDKGDRSEGDGVDATEKDLREVDPFADSGVIVGAAEDAVDAEHGEGFGVILVIKDGLTDLNNERVVFQGTSELTVALGCEGGHLLDWFLCRDLSLNLRGSVNGVG